MQGGSRGAVTHRGRSPCEQRSVWEDDLWSHRLTSLAASAPFLRAETGELNWCCTKGIGSLSVFHGTCQASFPPSRTWPWWSTARGKARFSILFCSLESLVAARNNFDADCPQLTRSILRTILLSLAAMTFFGEGVGYQLPRLAVFQRVALRPLVAHGFEGPLGPLGSPGSATMVRLATLSGAAVPQQQRGPSAGRGGHPRRGLPPTPWAPTACEPLPMSPGPISRAAPRRWVQEGSHAELGSLRAAGEGQNRHLSCPRL